MKQVLDQIKFCLKLCAQSLILRRTIRTAGFDEYFGSASTKSTEIWVLGNFAVNNRKILSLRHGTQRCQIIHRNHTLSVGIKSCLQDSRSFVNAYVQFPLRDPVVDLRLMDSITAPWCIMSENIHYLFFLPKWRNTVRRPAEENNSFKSITIGPLPKPPSTVGRVLAFRSNAFERHAPVNLVRSILRNLS